jgi:hypothetical protein
MPVIQFYAAVLRLALLLAFLGVLKSCTLDLLGLSAQKTGQGMMSYSRYTRLLTQ